MTDSPRPWNGRQKRPCWWMRLNLDHLRHRRSGPGRGGLTAMRARPGFSRSGAFDSVPVCEVIAHGRWGGWRQPGKERFGASVFN
jgi:hypothetical protein